MSAAEKLDRRPMTFREFLDFEASSDVKHEIWDGELVAMAGASPEHDDVAANIAGELHALLKGTDCRSSNSDQMVYQPSWDKGVYPDVSVACEPREFGTDSSGSERVLLNPRVVVEVLSRSTAFRDLGEKMEGYLSIPSLQAYVLIDPTTAWVRVVSRTDNGWLLTTQTDVSGSLGLECLKIRVPLTEIYAGVRLSERSLVMTSSPVDGEIDRS